MDLIFFMALASTVAALTPLALPLLSMARDAIPSRSQGSDGVAPEARTQLEVELAVRGRLYGEGSDQR